MSTRPVTVIDGCIIDLPAFFDRGERVLPCGHGRKWRFQATRELEVGLLVSEVVEPLPETDA